MANKRDATAVRSVKSAERVLTLLETIGITPAGTTFSQLNANLRIPKSSLHALLEVLTSRDYIELDPDTRRYSLGVRVWETGYAYHRHHGVLKQAQEVLEKVVARVNETMQFAKLVGSENVYLAKVDIPILCGFNPTSVPAAGPRHRYRQGIACSTRRRRGAAALRPERFARIHRQHDSYGLGAP